MISAPKNARKPGNAMEISVILYGIAYQLGHLGSNMGESTAENAAGLRRRMIDIA